MKLYYAPGACSLAPHILLQETQLPHELEKVDLKAHKTQHGDNYYKFNTKGYVPLLELDNGEMLSEGPVIAQYICDQAGRDDLMPAAGTMARYRVMEWQNYITSELHKSFGPTFNPTLNPEIKTYLVEGLKRKYEWVDTQLQGKPYLTGDNFTAADAYLFTVTNWAKLIDLDLSAHNNLQDYMARISERPAVQEALKEEGLLSG